MEQWNGSKLGKEYTKAVYCHPAYLTYMQSTSRDTLGWMDHKLELRFLGNINDLKYVDDTTIMAESEEELKSLLMRVKKESEKVDLTLNIKKKKFRSWHLVPSLHGKQTWEKIKAVTGFLGLQNHCRWRLQP